MVTSDEPYAGMLRVDVRRPCTVDLRIPGDSQADLLATVNGETIAAGPSGNRVSLRGLGRSDVVEAEYPMPERIETVRVAGQSGPSGVVRSPTSIRRARSAKRTAESMCGRPADPKARCDGERCGGEGPIVRAETTASVAGPVWTFFMLALILTTLVFRSSPIWVRYEGARRRRRSGGEGVGRAVVGLLAARYSS
ncbi:hypothetical protein GCM10023317_16060 [Actinopolymorpha pittospori]